MALQMYKPYPIGYQKPPLMLKIQLNLPKIDKHQNLNVNRKIIIL